MGFAYKNKHLHFVGVGGVSMSGLIRIAKHLGAVVTGSDKSDSATLRALRHEGYDVYVGHRPDVAGACDLLVYTSAVNAEDPERRAAPRELERSLLLAHIASLYPTVVAVAGTHGKTTIAGMLTSILQAAAVPFTAHIGGIIPSTASGVLLGGNDVFLTEACEYRRHFLTLSPTVGIVGAVEHDHPDCYADLDRVYEAFEAFALRCKALVTADSRLICMAEHTHISTYRDTCIRQQEGHPNAYVMECAGVQLPLTLGVWGGFNMRNASLAAQGARVLGIPPEIICEGLAAYRGIERRQQYIGTFGGMPVISDYAHHPTEICALTRAARARYGSTAVVFEPHTYSRTKALLDAFATAFDADALYLLPTYAARETADDDVDRQLYAAVKLQNKTYADWDRTRELLCELPHKKYGAILFVGAGNVHEYAKYMVALEQK